MNKGTLTHNSNDISSDNNKAKNKYKYSDVWNYVDRRAYESFNFK